MAKNSEYLDLLDLAKRACVIGKEILLKHYGNLQKIESKRDAGLVSEADKESEDAIREFLAKETPEYSFLGEESGLSEATVKSAPRWICDPLDGTTNYIHQFPYFCVSIGLQLNDEMVVGAVDLPCFDQVYSAYKGGGAKLNDKAIRVSNIEDPNEGLFVTGFSYKRGKELEEQIDAFFKIMQHARGVRRTGSAAIDLCLVASGVFDGYWERYLNPWDSSGGAVIIREAGGLVTDFSGRSYDPFANEVLAAGPGIHSKIVELFKQ